MTFALRARSLPLSLCIAALGCVGVPDEQPKPTASSTPAPGSTAREAANPRPAQPAASAALPATRSRAVEQGTIPFGDSGSTAPLAPFFPGTTYDAAVPAPDARLREPLGTFTAHYAEIVAYLRALEAASPRIKVVPFGRTHEGRELVYAVIGLPEHIRDLGRIQADLGRLADPRGLSSSDAERIVKSSPAVAWLGYSIHGDEMSGSDASMAVAHHFVAGTSADVTDLLQSVVVVIDPSLNPDGRERILSQLEQSAGYVPNLDADSMNRGRWPYGRGNHYLFDMNRDWIFGTQPETRARWAAIQSFHPQLLVDAHEMGALDTYLFYPPTDPFAPHIPQSTHQWWKRFGDDQARAFDRRGWSYYTREWADSWYLGYSDSWGTFNGAVGILYEQARFMGQSVRRASGEITTYREAVERQATSSVTNVATLARNREAILADYLAEKRKNVAADTPGNERMFVLAPGRNPDRDAAFVRLLTGQGIEVFRAEESFTARNVDTVLRGKLEEREFQKECIVVPARQPLSPLLKSALAFDPRFDKDSLNRERTELERKQRSKIYDVTAWSPAHLFDVDGSWCDVVDVRKTRVTALPERSSGIVGLGIIDAGQGGDPGPGGEPVYGWIVDGDDDRAVAFAAKAMELGLALHLCDEPFAAAGRKFARQSLLVRRHENGEDAEERVRRAAESAGVLAYASATARSPDDSPDLGGQHFHLLARPRVALVSNWPVSTDSFGHTWHLLDTELAIPCTLIDAQSFEYYDLRRYNVVILPEAGGDMAGILAKHGDALRTWVQGGGTLIASGSSAVMLTNKELKLTSVRLRQDALADLDRYAEAVRLEREAGKTPVDEALLWDPPTKGAKKTSADKDGEKEALASDAKSDAGKSKDAKPEELERREKRARIFAPRGTILRADVNRDAWLSAGCGDEISVLFDGASVFLSELPVSTPVRFAAADRLRLSGLLWPEARERIADSAYATVERNGAGQVILFAAPPDFRAWTLGTARLLSNAVVYGPGVGASQPLMW